MVRKVMEYLKRKHLGDIEYARRLGVMIGERCKIVDIPNWGTEPWLITFGDHVELSYKVDFITHDGATWCFRELEQYRKVIRYGKIVIHDNCFIGAHSTILPGVAIGPNVVVGAGSLVTKDLAPNAVYAGVPARYICTLEEYAEKCLRETPKYDEVAYRVDKRSEIMRIYDK